MDRILIVDNDEGLAHFLARLFTRLGLDVTTSTDGPDALQRIAREPFDLILLDYKMPGLDGLQTLTEIKRASVKTPVIVMTAHGTTDTAIEAMKLGAYDYLLKPFDTEELKRIATDALQVNRLMKEVVSISEGATQVLPADAKGPRIVGNNRKMQEVFKLIGQVAAKDVTVLITGESGTGKELVARAIYHHSARRDRPFMAINCATIPDTLFESELFGHERGAFTGADRTYHGRFERCDGGTLFFDEIGDMFLGTQAKVLRVLQEGQFERLGSTATLKADVRILAATNKDLEAEVRAGRFREDLYYRLKVIGIAIPPLRERRDDIPTLVGYFVGRFAGEYSKPVRFVSDAATRKLQLFHWPGNVRELENVLRRAVLVAKGDAILPEHVIFEGERGEPAAAPAAADDPEAAFRRGIEDLFPRALRLAEARPGANLVDLAEETLIRKALAHSDGNQVHAARLLGITRNILRHRLKKYGLDAGSG